MTGTDSAESVVRDALDTTQSVRLDALSRLTALSDPTRLELLIAIHAAPGAPVKVLAAATGLAPNTVTQALVTLREAGLVYNVRDGRLSRWHLADEATHALLHHLGAPHTDLHPRH